jgi:predicted NodU family carbamoyl transferase
MGTDSNSVVAKSLLKQSEVLGEIRIRPDKSNKNIPNILCENSMLSNMNLFLSNRSLNTTLFPYLKNMNFQKKADLAYSVQQSLEKIFLERIDYTIKKTNCKNIVFSGGCALNVVGNSKIKKNFPKIKFYVDVHYSFLILAVLIVVIIFK